MQKEFVEKTALQAAVKGLKSGQAGTAEAKAFAEAILDLCDRFEKDVPMADLLALQNEFPRFAGTLIAAVASETKQAEDAAVLELRRRLKRED